MGKLVVKKSVAEEIKRNLASYQHVKNEKNAYESGDFVEKMQNLALTEENEQNLVKLQESKNLFYRGQFDEYKIFSKLENQTIPFTKTDNEVEKGMELRYVVPKSGKRKPYYQHFKCRDKLEYNPSRRLECEKHIQRIICFCHQDAF